MTTDISEKGCEAMDVSKIPPYVAQPVEKSQEMNPPDKLEEKTSGVRETSMRQDRVQLSDRYHEVNLAKQVTMESEDIRTAKVEELRKQINSGTYVVQPEKLAEKMLGEIW